MQKRPYPKVIITKKAAKLLASGHVWVYAGEVIRLEAAHNVSAAEATQVTNKVKPVPNGCVVDVFEENGTWHGAGLLSLESQIRVRIITTNANDHIDDAFWKRKLTWAWEYRKTVMSGQSLPGNWNDTRMCRVIFSEADGMGGLIVDRYDNVLVAQVGTVGMDLLKEKLLGFLVEILRNDGQEIQAVYERSDAPARAKEGLALVKGWMDLPGTSPLSSPLLRVQENGLWFELNIEQSQKTGFFLDQKYNRQAVRKLAHNKRVLDCFCHVGPFGLNAAAGDAAYVRCVDISQTALDLARHNATLNTLNTQVDFTCANVMEYLPSLANNRALLQHEGGPFDLIIVDPPAFTKSRGTQAHAARGYHELNAAALKLLPRGGYLATCSCSHFMSRDALAKEIFEAARAQHKTLRLVEERQQAPDHPIVWGIPQTHYLDFFIFQVV